MSRRVVVTGGSCVTSLGMELDDIFSELKSLKNHIVRMDDWDKYAQMNTRLAGPILYDLPEYPRKKVRGAGRVGVLAITSADKAMQMAGLAGEKELLKSGRVGVHAESAVQLRKRFCDDVYPVHAADMRCERKPFLWPYGATHHDEYRLHER